MGSGAPSGQRLELHHVDAGREHFDGILVRPDDRAAVAKIARRATTPGRTLARRREVVERARKAADLQGWTLTAEEQAMLRAFCHA
ncbi:MAG: hypothetical protein WC558_15265 [Patulibacter sp.]